MSRNEAGTRADIILADTITKLGPNAPDSVILSGSHGGVYPGYVAARAGVRAVVLNDATGGLQDAGYGSLPYCQKLGIAAATVDGMTARIGSAADMQENGIISRANDVAVAAGVATGMTCAEALEKLRSASPPPGMDVPTDQERREEINLPGAKRKIVLIDSAAMPIPDDAGQVVITGSHGALLGGNPMAALKVDAFAAFYNDAGFGPDDWGVTRLPALQGRGIAGICVAATSARIGEAGSTYRDGIVSAVNELAEEYGIRIGMPAIEAADHLAKV